MRNLFICGCLSLAAIGTANADEIALSARDVRVTVEIGAASQIDEVVIETRSGLGWVVDEAETLEAESVIAEGEVAAAAASSDCNGNGIDDAADIAAGAEDVNRNGRLDSCERARGDVNLSGSVNVYDVYFVLGLWDTPNNSAGDLDGDGEISGGDISLVLLGYGT